MARLPTTCLRSKRSLTLYDSVARSLAIPALTSFVGSTCGCSAFSIAVGDVSTANSLRATVESGESPPIVGSTGGHSLWWLFTAPLGGMYRVSTAGSLFDTTLAIYTRPSSRLTDAAQVRFVFDTGVDGVVTCNDKHVCMWLCVCVHVSCGSARNPFWYFPHFSLFLRRR